jgi:hypothetical protein
MATFSAIHWTLLEAKKRKCRGGPCPDLEHLVCRAFVVPQWAGAVTAVPQRHPASSWSWEP